MNMAPERPKAMTAEELRKLLTEKNVSQTALADAIGVNRRTVVRWLAGDTPISKRNALLIKTVLKVK